MLLYFISEDIITRKLSKQINRNKIQQIASVHNATESTLAVAENISVEVGGCETSMDLVVIKSSPTALILGSSHFACPISWTKANTYEAT